MILKRLSMAMTFSQGTRSLEMSRFLALSLADNGFFLLRFLGMFVLACALCRPLYPLSITALVFGCRRTFDLLNSLKSWRRPLPCAMHRMRRVDFSTTSWVFSVCRFFLPE